MPCTNSNIHSTRRWNGVGVQLQLHEEHHPDPLARFTEPPPLREDASEVEQIKHLLLTMTGRALYARRKCTVEPVFGMIKAILGFRQFSLRELENVKGEFNLVVMAWNLKRMFVLAG